MTSDEVRVYVNERLPWIVAHSFVAPGKKYHASAITGYGSETKCEASGYGVTEDEALSDLERAIAAPPAIASKAPGARARINHVAQPREPLAPFNSVCMAEGCGRDLTRVYGVQARRSGWRHTPLPKK